MRQLGQNLFKPLVTARPAMVRLLSAHARIKPCIETPGFSFLLFYFMFFACFAPFFENDDALQTTSSLSNRMYVDTPPRASRVVRTRLQCSLTSACLPMANDPRLTSSAAALVPAAMAMARQRAQVQAQVQVPIPTVVLHRCPMRRRQPCRHHWSNSRSLHTPIRRNRHPAGTMYSALPTQNCAFRR